MLEAQERSVLCIFGNSSCVADWDEKLGFSKKTFIATLRSLSPEGGTAALMDLTILKVYPIGFRESGEAGKDQAPWNEAEEQARQITWEVSRLLVTRST